MGAIATLVLVNGRRMTISPMTAGLSQAVNVNQLPTQGVDRIEVLRVGASSIYGSDAVGGVLKCIMKREFGARLHMSIINLSDKEPPLAADNFGYDPGVSQSLMTGRSWNVEITRKF